uniref:mitochondrial fission factor homolog B isoform X2 n=1 Tax=Ciona intestinalis TaxID=7719 RepID=UPI000EF4CFE9|nr:mitochondrial fission factor homolog B isoform X2 [Ciona intestinalis]|eukprot:XP_026691381.1 mitochondrial fission factor homolog B isoform X2 [Ciona intestinalis]
MNQQTNHNDLETTNSNQLVNDNNYTEDINTRMKVPTKLSALQENGDDYPAPYQQMSTFSADQERYIAANPALRMEVPERIVVSVGESGSKFSAGDARSSSPLFDQPYAATVSLATPPRVLTVQDSPLYRNSEETHSSHKANHSTDSLLAPNVLDLNQVKVKPVMGASDAADAFINPHQLLDNLQKESKKFYEQVMAKLRQTESDDSDSDTDGYSDQMALTDLSSTEDLDDVSLMKKQIFKLHRRITVLEKHQSDTNRINYCVYGFTVAFWLLNGWFLYNHRRLY